MKLLVTGASGLFGSRFAELAEKEGHEVFSGYSKDKVTHGTPVQFDVAEQSQVAEAFSKACPDVVVHAATLTDVDKCELNRELAWKINVEGTRNVAEAAKAAGAFLVYVSTDYVFSGEKGHYKETDVPNPINYYGVTKLRAEQIVQETIKNCCIARTCVIYGASPAAGKVNFALWLINNLKAKNTVPIVTDQWISPTLNTSLAQMMLEIVERRLTGVYHLSGATRVSRLEYVTQLAEVFGLGTDVVKPVKATDITSWIAKRPKDSSLDTSKAQQALRCKPLELGEALALLKKELEG